MAEEIKEEEVGTATADEQDMREDSLSTDSSQSDSPVEVPPISEADTHDDDDDEAEMDMDESDEAINNEPVADKIDDEDKPVNIVDERGTGGKKIQGHIIINNTNSSDASWFVCHTTSGHEARVAETLRQRVETMRLEEKIHEILIPTQDRVVIRQGKKSTIKEKIFPGYLLVKLIMDDPTWLAVRTTPGITGFVGAGKTPTPLSEKEVENIQKFVSTPAKRFKTKFSKGEAVKITDGPFNDFLGTIDEIDQEKGKVKVLVSIFGRETPVELDLLQIAKV